MGGPPHAGNTTRIATRPTRGPHRPFPDSGPPGRRGRHPGGPTGLPGLGRTPAPARGDLLRRLGDLLVDNKEEIADAMTREMGKVLAETRGDVQEGIDTAYYAATEGRRLFGTRCPRNSATSGR